MSKAYKPLPAAEDLWELFSYNPLTGQLHWRESRAGTSKGAAAGSRTRLGYHRILFKNVYYQAHRVVWAWATGKDPERAIDHKNADKLDNRLWNLRLATQSQNGWNRSAQKDNSSGFKGVYWNHKKWSAKITKKGQVHYLGSFDTPEEAHQAYCEAAADLHGDFARMR